MKSVFIFNFSVVYYTMPKKSYIDDEQLIQLCNDHVPMFKIAEFFNCSVATITRKKRQLGIRSYTNISQNNLEKAVIEIKQKNSKSDYGVRLTKAELKKNNIIVGSNRVLETLRSIDSEGLEKRKGKTVKRRQYVCPHGNKVFFPFFNYLLIRFGTLIIMRSYLHGDFIYMEL